MIETQEVVDRQLKVADRCDKCGSQAFVLVKGISGELMFCGHHYKKNQDALEKYFKIMILLNMLNFIIFNF